MVDKWNRIEYDEKKICPNQEQTECKIEQEKELKVKEE